VSVYYNEHDKQKAAVLLELMREAVIAQGDVDTRSVKDVTAGDVRGYTQCHWFAGIGVWSYAARLAGWPDGRPMWSGSCPCPSFSAAGKGGGFDDARHLWPDWGRLIGECKPAVVFGEQADDAIGYGWLDLVQTDLERASYAVGKAVLGACSVGAPHVRQRVYFVADATSAGFFPGEHERFDADAAVESGEMVQPFSARLEGYGGHGALGNESGRVGEDSAGSTATAGHTRGFWADTEWIPCRNPKLPGAIDWRPIEPGTFPLAHGAAARVLALRCFGDAIVAQVAAEWIQTYLELERG
jgi:DNA (cytosine-5)-methyltransferase 1